MKPEISNKKGTIANVFTKHKDKLFQLIQMDQYNQLRQEVDSLLNDPELKHNSAVEEARVTLDRCSRKKNLYYSTLMTYMTGMKVSF